MTTPDIGQRMQWRHTELEKGGIQDSGVQA